LEQQGEFAGLMVIRPITIPEGKAHRNIHAFIPALCPLAPNPGISVMAGIEG